MPEEQPDTDITWHRRLGRRLAPGEVGEDRTRGAYLNGRIAWVLSASLAGAVILLGAVLAFHVHG